MFKQLCRYLVLSAAISLAVIPFGANATNLLFPTSGYVASPTDMLVQADSNVCCIGDYHSLTTSYLMQTFKAIGTAPHSLTVGLLNTMPSDVPPAPFRFRLLITELKGNIRPSHVLLETPDISIPEQSGNFSDITVSLDGLVFATGREYAWIVDTFSTRDGIQNVGQWAGNASASIPSDVLPFLDGSLYTQSASGNGRLTDFSNPWTELNQIDAAFLLKYNAIPEPGNCSLMLVGVAMLLLLFRRRILGKARRLG